MSNEDKPNYNNDQLKNIAFNELSIVCNKIFWVDFNSEGENLNKAIFARPFNCKDYPPQQLTNNKFNVKSHFHGYGGKSYKCIEFKNKIYLIWIDQITQALWFQTFEAAKEIIVNDNKYLLSLHQPKQLSKSMEVNFDSSFVISKENFMYGICEIKNSDYLFSLNLKETKQDIHFIKKFDNFAGDLSSNPSVNLLSWIEWNTPNMPWEKNDLFLAEINGERKITKIKKFSNRSINTTRKVSFFQPHWISDILLVCSEDSSFWWNILFIDVGDFENISIKKRLQKKFYEYGSPQWVSGITFFGGLINNLFFLVKKENIWILEQYQDLKFIKALHLPFCSVKNFSVYDKKLVLRGCGTNFLDCLLEIDFQEHISLNSNLELSFDLLNQFSKPESFWFKGFDNQPTHSFIYKPLVEKFKKPPLLVRAHSGPTAYFDGSYNSEVQYWASKGFFVAEVNYGGSSGFGREYRERLNKKWGIVDSYDCKALVMELLKLELVDGDKIIIFGNSAGGLTALNSLCYGDLFKAAICKYPVTDLIDMHYNTHRFERDYLNSLIGNFEQCQSEFIKRSPINKIKKIKNPTLFFHGKNDLVISYKQTLKIHKQLIQNNKISEVIFFENEGHGFKNHENKKIVIKKTEEFLTKILNI